MNSLLIQTKLNISSWRINIQCLIINNKVLFKSVELINILFYGCVDSLYIKGFALIKKNFFYQKKTTISAFNADADLIKIFT